MSGRPLLAAALAALAAATAAAPAGERAGPLSRVRVVAGEPSLAPDADRLAASAARTYERVESRLGLPGPDRVDVLLLRRLPPDPDERARLGLARTPSWAAGIAQPRLGRVVLFLDGQSRYPHRGVTGLLAHELAHVVLRDALPRGRLVPRWYDEGVAMVVERDLSVADALELAKMSIVGRPWPFEELAGDWPASAADARAAYAQSFSFVAFVEDGAEPGAPRRLVEALHGGRSFERAFEAAYGAPLVLVVREWQKAISWRYLTLPIIVTGTVINTAIGMLALLAYVTAVRRRRRKLREWDEEERWLPSGDEDGRFRHGGNGEGW